jgi:hypothetical protein
MEQNDNKLIKTLTDKVFIQGKIIIAHNDRITDLYNKLNMILETKTQNIDTVAKTNHLVLNKKRKLTHDIILNKKRKLEQDKDNIISRLVNGQKKSQLWKEGMSKYTTITYVKQNNKWILQSSIFKISEHFDTKEEAEKYYENIIKSYDIDVKYITRNGYIPKNMTENDAIYGLLSIGKKYNLVKKL